MISIRSSMIPSFPDCPRRAAARQWRDIITGFGYTIKQTLTPIGSPVGVALHAAGKFFLETKKETGCIPSVNQGTELAISSLELESQKGITYDYTTPSMDMAKKQTAILTKIFYFDIALKMSFEHFEVSRRAMITNEIEITGHSDYENVGELDDLKTGTTCGNCSGQLGTYSLQRRSYKLEPPSILRQLWLPRTSLKKPQPNVTVIPYDVAQSEKAAWFTIGNIASCMKRFLEFKEPWAFLANPMSRMCSEKYCPAHGTDWCREGR